MGKKQPKKRNWRKAKVEDVEEALEDENAIKRIKMKTTFNPKSKDDEDDADGLFTVDTKGSCEGISKASRREIARAKLFPKKPENIGLSWTEEAKIVRAERQVEARERPAKEKAPEVYDLWGAPPPKTRKNGVGGIDGRLRSAKPLPVNQPRTLHQKVGIAPAVIPAHEGQSMNPHREAYEDLACMAAAVELERERNNEELDRKLRPMTHELRDALGSDKLKEMSEEEKIRAYRELCLKKGVAAKESDEGGDDFFAMQGKKSKIKAQSVRNKKKRQIGVDAQEEQAKAQRRLEKSVGDVGSLLKEIKEETELHQSRKQYKASLREKRLELEATAGVVPKRRKIGGGRFAEEPAAVPDVEAAGKGLRSMPLSFAGGSVVRDRLSSVVRRGLLPPPAESSKQKISWQRKKNGKLKRSRKFLSPLLKDNLLLR
jgi:hypothetical protein